MCLATYSLGHWLLLPTVFVRINPASGWWAIDRNLIIVGCTLCQVKVSQVGLLLFEQRRARFIFLGPYMYTCKHLGCTSPFAHAISIPSRKGKIGVLERVGTADQFESRDGVSHSNCQKTIKG